jgi:predicted aspartyl protease
MGRFSVEFKLKNNSDVVLAKLGSLAADQVRQVTIEGLVDTGATRLVIPQKVADQLGVSEVGEVQVRYADRRADTRKVVGDMLLELQGRESIFRAIVEPNRDNALIGAIVLEELDFVVDCITQKLAPRDPNRIIAEIE